LATDKEIKPGINSRLIKCPSIANEQFCGIVAPNTPCGKALPFRGRSKQ